MDVSIFIGNQKRFWSWILLPLLVRLIFVGSVFAFTESVLIEYEEEAASHQAITSLKRQCDENQALLERYEADPLRPVNEQLYQLIAEKNMEYSLDVKADISMDTKKGNANVSLYSMRVAGAVPSVYMLSDYLADMLSDPLLILSECSYGSQSARRRFRGATEEPDTNWLACQFEKLSLTKVGGATPSGRKR